jgi:tetratricopeptide (TPR) repeat protein
MPTKNTLVIILAGVSLFACAAEPEITPDSTSSAATSTETANAAATKRAEKRYTAPIDLLPQALGPYAWKITTSSERAQAYFTQGMQLRYAYNVDEAARSLAEARRIDPSCAMCYWGEAFALGSYLNGGMTKTAAPLAYAAISKAAELAGSNANEMEQALIKATVVRYPKDYADDNRRPVDEAFAAAMAEVYAEYPHNPEVATVYAVALFMLEERRGNRDLADPDLIRLHAVLTGVTESGIQHPGACHLYIHATESSQQPDLGLPCAEYLGETVRVASHIQHMPSHTWNEVGMWGRSVRANVAAYQSDLKSRENQGFSYAPTHNLHMLLFAASYDGQGAVATQAGTDYRKESNNSMYEVLTRIRFGRFDEVVENDRRPRNPVHAALWDFAKGYASLKQGDIASAKTMRDSVLEFAATTELKFRFHPAGRVVGTAGHILEGEILWVEDDLDAAIAAFEKAVEVEDSMDYDEPEPLPFAARHWLGAALLEAGRYTDAEKTYREELADHPHNGWSLFGLQAALEGQGKDDPAVDLDFAESWARSDIWLRSSKF